jgi:hypothetical protein
MNRVLSVAVLLLAVGCKGTNGQRTAYSHPPDVIPSTANGITIDDRRPDWEKRPFTGPVSLFHLGKVNPNPWEQLAKETEAVLAEMPQKPDRVTVTVTAFRLIKKDDGAAAKSGDPVQVQVGNRNSTQGNRADFADTLNYQTALNAQRSGDTTTLQRVGAAITGQGPPGTTNGTPPVGVGVGSVKPPENENDFFNEYGPGATCEVHATIRLTFPGGQEQVLNAKGIGASRNTSDTAYWGDALDFSVRQAVLNYGNQFRKGVGLQPE